jgi:hypothetical protein
LSDFHILYSATALTDVLLGLWLVLAVDAIGRSLLQQDLRWAIGAGIFTGRAWWTKYNGWLPLAIEAAALPLLCWFLRPGRNQLLAWLTSFVATVATAAAVWTPYYLWLQSHGGYGPIAANHAKYVVGISGWLDAAARQLSNQYCIEGWTTIVGVVAAIVLPAVIFARGREQAGVALFMGVAVGYMAIQFTSFVGVIVWALPGLVCVLWSVDRSQLAEPAEKRRVVAGVLVFFWFAGLALLTPLYWPYPRLALPALCAAWIGTAICVAEGPLKGLTIPGWFSRSSWHLNGLLMFLALVVVLLALAKPDVKKVHLSGERRGIQTIATQIVAENKLGDPRVVYVYGEPALFFQLRAAGEPIVAPVQDVPTEPATIDGKPVATFLVVGPHAESDSGRERLFRQRTAPRCESRRSGRHRRRHSRRCVKRRREGRAAPRRDTTLAGHRNPRRCLYEVDRAEHDRPDEKEPGLLDGCRQSNSGNHSSLSRRTRDGKRQQTPRPVRLGRHSSCTPRDAAS